MLHACQSCMDYVTASYCLHEAQEAVYSDTGDREPLSLRQQQQQQQQLQQQQQPRIQVSESRRAPEPAAAAAVAAVS